MNGLYQIIEERSLELRNDPDVIKDEIESGKYPGLSLYGNQLVYKTEHIYPENFSENSAFWENQAKERYRLVWLSPMVRIQSRNISQIRDSIN